MGHFNIFFLPDEGATGKSRVRDKQHSIGPYPGNLPSKMSLPDPRMESEITGLPGVAYGSHPNWCRVNGVDRTLGALPASTLVTNPAVGSLLALTPHRVMELS